MKAPHKETFNNGTITVWFYTDNLMCYDKNKKLLMKDDKYICYFNFKEPTSTCLGEMVQNPEGNIIVLKTEERALDNAINHVKIRFDLND